MRKTRNNEHGVGVVEVLVALVIIMISALAFSNIQTSTHMNMRMTDTRFKVNERAQDILEVLKANSISARAGIYNLDYDDTVVVDANSVPALVVVSRWKSAIVSDFVSGAGRIDCTNVRCVVSIRWSEKVGNAMATQSYELAGLL